MNDHMEFQAWWYDYCIKQGLNNKNPTTRLIALDAWTASKPKEVPQIVSSSGVRLQFWCEHVGGLGPPFPFCEICAKTARQPLTYKEGFIAGLEAAAQEVEKHWNNTGVMVDQTEQAERSARAIRLLRGEAKWPGA